MESNKNQSLAEELSRFLIKLGDSKDKEKLRKQASRLIESITPDDFASAERKLIDNGVSVSKIHKLSAMFLMLGLIESECADLRRQLPDYHILRKVMAEHDMIRCFLSDLEDVAEHFQVASKLAVSSSEFMRLSHIVEHLNSLEEHISREDDVLYPALQEHDWKSLFIQISTEHTYIMMAVNDLLKLVFAFENMPFSNFKTRLLSTVRYLCPLLREHLFHEDRVLFPLAISMNHDEKLWERLRHICNQIDYCGIHL
jgi:DUF438 domain-containing protein